MDCGQPQARLPNRSHRPSTPAFGDPFLGHRTIRSSVPTEASRIGDPDESSVKIQGATGGAILAGIANIAAGLGPVLNQPTCSLVWTWCLAGL